MFSLRNKVNESRIENNAFLPLQMLWWVEEDIVTSGTDRLHQVLMDETLSLFQRYRAMFSLRNKVNQSRIENNAFLRLQMLWRVEKDIVTVTRTDFSSCSWMRLFPCSRDTGPCSASGTRWMKVGYSWKGHRQEILLPWSPVFFLFLKKLPDGDTIYLFSF